jgi:hypothetical protein
MIDPRAALALAAMQPCLMCGETANGVGAFVPYDSEAYGAEPGKQRMVFYALCSVCLATTTPEQREAKFDGWRVR